MGQIKLSDLETYQERSSRFDIDQIISKISCMSITKDEHEALLCLAIEIKRLKEKLIK